jgi:hypothetical protein
MLDRLGYLGILEQGVLFGSGDAGPAAGDYPLPGKSGESRIQHSKGKLCAAVTQEALDSLTMVPAFIREISVSNLNAAFRIAQDIASADETFQETQASLELKAGSQFSARIGHIVARCAGIHSRENDGNQTPCPTKALQCPICLKKACNNNHPPTKDPGCALPSTWCWSRLWP